MTTAREQADLLDKMLVYPPRLDKEQKRAINEALYTLQEGHAFDLPSFDSVIQCWRIVESALKTDLKDRIDHFKL